MRQIKFRGKNIMTGQIHYGFYSECPAVNSNVKTCITDKNLDTWEVEPESVAQLVGYDINGWEVYEGDLLEDIDDDDVFRTSILTPRKYSGCVLVR